MKEIEMSKSDKTSNLQAELKNVEKYHFRHNDAEIAEARNSVVESTQAFIKSRFEFGRVLVKYKLLFKEQRGWMEAAEVIAKAIDRDKQTVFRIITDYERAFQLTPIYIDAMKERNLDPAAAKNIPIVENLIQLPNPETREAAAEAVAEAIHKLEAQKKEKMTTKSFWQDLDVFAAKIVKLFETQFHYAKQFDITGEVQYVLEHVVNALQVPIRELRQDGQPTLVLKPAIKAVA